VTAVSDHAVVINGAWIDPGVFDSYERIAVDASEPYAANVVRVGDRVVAAAAFPRTNERLAACGARLAVVEVSEIAKAEGALTCCSLILRPTN
jgi:dimethylargininase